MKTKEKDTMKQFLQKQPYNLTMARHTLGIHQLRIMVRILEMLQPYMSLDEKSCEGEIKVEIKISDLVIGENYKPLRDALHGMIKKVVTIYEHPVNDDLSGAPTIETGMPMIRKYEYDHGSKFVKIWIEKEILSQIIDLTRGYTKYCVDVALKTSSPNIFKLYQYIAHFRDKKQIQCNVDTLRKWLQLEEKYQLPAHIKIRILEPAIKELKEKADVWFDIAERVTEGRKMIGWKFNIYTKKEKRTTQNKLSTNGKHGKTFQRLCEKFDLSEGQAKKIIKNVPEKEIHKTLYDIHNLVLAGKVSNKGGYTAKVLSEKYNVRL